MMMVAGIAMANPEMSLRAIGPSSRPCVSERPAGAVVGGILRQEPSGSS